MLAPIVQRVSKHAKPTVLRILIDIAPFLLLRSPDKTTVTAFANTSNTMGTNTATICHVVASPVSLSPPLHDSTYYSYRSISAKIQFFPTTYSTRVVAHC